jgi:hypothetical protein
VGRNRPISISNDFSGHVCQVIVDIAAFVFYYFQQENTASVRLDASNKKGREIG